MNATQTFENMEEARSAFLQFSAENNLAYIVKESRPKRFVALCPTLAKGVTKGDNCRFRVSLNYRKKDALIHVTEWNPNHDIGCPTMTEKHRLRRHYLQNITDSLFKVCSLQHPLNLT